MLTTLCLHNTLCTYFLKKPPPPFTNFKKAPLKQIMRFMANISTISHEKACELIFRIFFKRFTPRSDFDVLAEINKIDSYEKSTSFKKMYAKRLFTTVSHLKTHYQRLGFTQQFDEPLAGGADHCDCVQKIHSDYFPSLILFHDKWVILTMREVMGALVMSKFSQQFLESVPKKDFRRLAHLISGGNFAEIPFIKSILKKEEVVEMDNFSVNNDSLFNFSTTSGVSKNTGKSRSFSFNLSKLSSNL